MNPKTFLEILQGEGDKLKGKGTGKVLKSRPSDDVFVYFADHGGHQRVNFPNDYLSARTLTNTLNIMHKKNLYKNELQTPFLSKLIPNTSNVIFFHSHGCYGGPMGSQKSLKCMKILH